jgi:hypothetical protein
MTEPKNTAKKRRKKTRRGQGDQDVDNDHEHTREAVTYEEEPKGKKELTVTQMLDQMTAKYRSAKREEAKEEVAESKRQNSR